LTKSFKWHPPTRITSRETSGKSIPYSVLQLGIYSNNPRPRLSKKHELFVFFRITDAQRFKTHLAALVPLLTTARDAEKFRTYIYKKKAEGTIKGLEHLSAINVAFSAKGLEKVSHETS
jgi:hypothetical protein